MNHIDTIPRNITHTKNIVILNLTTTNDSEDDVKGFWMRKEILLSNVTQKLILLQTPIS
jgi:hypothetical protein